MNSSVSVIICTRNRFDDFPKTISSLIIQSRLPDELIVVDSSDVLQIEAYLNSISLPIKFRYFHTSPGLTLQRNYGIRESRGDLLFFFDDDVDLDVNYIAQVEKIFEADIQHEIGAVGGRITNLINNQSSTLRSRFEKAVFGFIRIFFGLGDFGSGRYRLSGMPTFPHLLMTSGSCETLTGCCMAFRRKVFEAIEFDEHLPGYGLMEDVDISKRILDIGYGVFYNASATLIHHVSPKNRLKLFEWAEMSVVNYDYLFRKNWSRDWFRYPFYYWALIGLIVINFHNRNALQGTISGIAKLWQKQSSLPISNKD